MGSMDRSRKKVHLWKKAVVHFLLCFVMGFFIGFAPTGKSSFPSTFQQPLARYNKSIELAPRPDFEKQSKQIVDLGNTTTTNNNNNVNRSLAETLVSSTEQQDTNLSEETEDKEEIELTSRKQLIVVTPTNDRDPLRGVLLTRLANTLKLVPPPVLWIVVESQLESSDVSEILRMTGVMYRHLVFKENFTTNVRAETDHQRNLALKHIEHHRLSGIVHFAGLSNVYDLSFFDEFRAIEAMGTWPLAKLSTRRKKAIIEGPVCQSSQVIGWHLKNTNSEELGLHISSFGFNSSILWDPERWGRLSSSEGTNQNSLKFVKQAVFEDETKLKGIPQEDCSKVNLWQLQLSIKTVASHVPGHELGERQR